MKFTIFTLLHICCITTVFARINWQTSLYKARKIALEKNQSILVNVFSDSCRDCELMDNEFWSKKDIVKASENFVSLKIDYDKNNDFACYYNIKKLPTTFVFDIDGRVFW